MKDILKDNMKSNLRDRLYVATFQDKAIETAAQYGLGLEYNHTCISQSLDPENRDQLLDSMVLDSAAAGRTPSEGILHGPFTEIYPSAIDPASRQMSMMRLNQAYDVCQALSINGMVVHCGWLPFIYFKEWHVEKSAEFWLDFMKDKPADFHIYIENVLEDEPYMFKAMMEKIQALGVGSSIKLCLDTGHANAMTQPKLKVEDWIKVLGPHIGHFHLHNNDGTSDSHSALGDGALDMERLLVLAESECAGEGYLPTYTIEARDSAASAQWLDSKGFLGENI